MTRTLRRPLLPAALLAAAVALSGCGEGGLAGGLRQVGIGATTPDEFMVLPTRPLEMPPDLTLPPPMPGATNRVAYQPQAEAIEALAGRPAAPSASAPGLLARVGGAAPDIRATVVADDAAYRQRNRLRLLDRWFRRDQRRLVYAPMTLDADAEWRRLRAAGVRVPAAPPAP